MLTPAEISGKEFEKVFFGGYDMTGVDDFLESITSDYTALYKENGILKNKLKVLVEKIEEYRSTEDAMRMALLTAQKMGDDLVAEAERKRNETLGDLEKQAEERRREIDALLSDEKARLEAAIAERERFVETSKTVIGTYLDFLSKLGAIKHPPAPEPAPPTREEKINDAAREIDSAVERIVSAGQQAPEPKAEEPVAEPVFEDEIKITIPEDEAEPTRVFAPKSEAEDESGDETSRTIRINFDDLQFGSNYKS